MHTKNLIVGGGLSGLKIASELEEKNADYLLLEARERFGGRILSANIDDNPHLKYDLGPSWIWANQPRLELLLKEFSLDVFPQYSKGLLAFENGDGQVQNFDYATMAGSYRIKGGIGTIIDALLEKSNREKLLLLHAVKSVEKKDNLYKVAVSTPTGEINISAENIIFCIPPRLVANSITFLPKLPVQARTKMSSIPTWMAPHVKIFAIYERPFWREMGLSGDGMSHKGPLMEIHDATVDSTKNGALFGFVGIPKNSPMRETSVLKKAVISQLKNLFGEKANSPIEIIIQDWSKEIYTATSQDTLTAKHPRYSMPNDIAKLKNNNLFFASSEMAPNFGGLIEGALEAAQNVLEELEY